MLYFFNRLKCFFVIHIKWSVSFWEYNLWRVVSAALFLASYFGRSNGFGITVKLLRMSLRKYFIQTCLNYFLFMCILTFDIFKERWIFCFLGKKDNFIMSLSAFFWSANQILSTNLSVHKKTISIIDISSVDFIGAKWKLLFIDIDNDNIVTYHQLPSKSKYHQFVLNNVWI